MSAFGGKAEKPLLVLSLTGVWPGSHIAKCSNPICHNILGRRLEGHSIVVLGIFVGASACVVRVIEVRRGFAPDVTGCCRPSQSAR